MAPTTRSTTSRNTPAPPPPAPPSAPPFVPNMAALVPNMDALTALFTSMQEQLSTANCRVAKLGDNNYTRWKRDMTVYLQDVNLWEVVTQPPDPATAATPEWTRKDRHALAVIHNCCDPLRQDLFAQCNHAHDAWAKLAATFESRDAATVQRLYSAFNNTRKSSDESMLTYISRVKSASLQLASVGEVVSRTVLFNTIISGLGDQFEAVKVYLAVDPALTEERLSQVLLAEESRLLARRSDRDLDRGRQRFPRDRDRSISPNQRPRSPRYRSPYQHGRGNRYCPTCDMYGHDEPTCYRLHPDLLTRRRAAQPPRPSQCGDQCRPQGDQYRPPTARLGEQYRGDQYRPPAPASQPRPSSSAAAYSMQSSTDSAHSPTTYTHGYALPVQLDDETVWDYYHNALVMGHDDSTALTLDALHRYNIAIATGVACWSAQALPSLPRSPGFTRPPQPGDYVSVPQPGQWLIDSGASNHFTSSRHLLSGYRECPEQKILTGNGYIIAKGIGNVTLHSSVGLRTIFDVLYVPDLSGKHNLLSIPQLVRKGCLISMSKSDGCVISSPDNALVLLQGSFTGKSFIVDMSVCRTSSQIAKLRVQSLPTGQFTLLPGHLSDEGQLSTFQSDHIPNIALLAGTEDTQPVEIWHMRLGHLNQAAIQQLTTVATGLKIGPPRPQTVSMRCESCLRGSQHKNISYHRSPGATKRLQHVWADVKGPLLEKDLYGFRYFCTFICEFTRWTVQYPLLHKNHVFGAYKLYEARYERLANEKVLYLHIDGGSEYLTNEFRTYLRGRGVALSNTQPYSPEMNSIAERAMRTIIEHASAMLWNASLPVGFWSQAVETSVYLLNRSPHSALHARTPYEAWHGVKPNLGHLRIFGCRAAAHVPDELRTKTDWSSKSTPDCIFIGYSETENLFKLWDINKRDVIRKRDVVFWEHEMGHPTLKYPLTHGVSICADIGIAEQIVNSLTEELTPPAHPIPSSNPAASLPLLPLDARQSIDKISPDPPTNPTYRFIPYVPPGPANPIPNVPRPVLADQTAHYASAVTGASSGPANLTPNIPPDATGTQNAHYTSNPVPLDDVPPPADQQHVFPHDPAPLLPDDTLELLLAYADPPDAFDMSPRELLPVSPIAPLDRDIPNSYKQAMRHPRSARWKVAMEAELSTLRKNDTWDLVPLPPGRKAFPNKWVFSYVGGPKLLERMEKEMRQLNNGELTEDMRQYLDETRLRNDQVVEKARLVARGDLQRHGIDYTETYAPVVKCVSLRILLIWAARRQLVTRHWDIVSAFLHGNLDLEVFMQQPQGFADGTNRVCRLKKAIYGLCQAARQFYIRLDEILRDLQFTRLASDWAIWIRPHDGAFIAVHVDDMAAAAVDDSTLDAIAKLLGSHLELKDLGSIRDYLGITIHRDNNVFSLSQERYITQLLPDYAMDSAFEVHTPALESDRDRWNKDDSPLLATPKAIKQYQALVGSLLYLMHATRPDLAFPVIRLSQYSAHPRDCHWQALKCILRYLKSTSSASLILGTPSVPDNDGLVGYFDAAHADNIDRRSTCGYIFLLFGSPISWASKVQRTIALSTTEAELMAGTEAAREALWIKGLTNVLFGTLRCELRGDNQGALALAVNPVFHQRTKHIEIRHRFISEAVNDGLLNVKYVPTKDMLADSLTKPLPRDSHLDHCLRIGLRLHPASPTVEHSLYMVILQKKRKFKCDDCGNLFANLDALQRHRLKKES